MDDNLKKKLSVCCESAHHNCIICRTCANIRLGCDECGICSTKCKDCNDGNCKTCEYKYEKKDSK